MIGTYRETVTLTLDDFKRRGLVTVGRRTCRFWIDAALRRLPTCDHPVESDVNPSHTQSCRGESWPAWRFRFVASGHSPITLCLWCALRYRSVVRRAFVTAWSWARC